MIKVSEKKHGKISVDVEADFSGKNEVKIATQLNTESTVKVLEKCVQHLKKEEGEKEK